MKLRRAIGSSACVLGVAVGMSLAMSGGRMPRYGGEIRVQVARLPADMDPLRMRGEDAGIVAGFLYEGLTTMASGEIEPAVASRWLRDDDGQRWLFVLRDNVVFHDGSRCDAEAVRSALERLADPRQSSYSWLLSSLAGWEDFAAGRSQQIEGLYVLQPDQLEIQLTAPMDDLPARLALPCAAIARRRGDEWLGTGPFRLESVAPGSIRLTANREHASGRPFVDRIQVVAVPTATPALEGGVADLARALPTDARPTGAARWRAPAERLAIAAIRPRSAALASAALRRRLNDGFDRTVFVRAVLNGDGRETRDLIPLGPKVIAARGAEPQGDLAMRPQTRARVITLAGEPVLRALGERVQVHLFALGLEATLDVLTADAFATAIASRAFDVVVMGWTPPQARSMPLEGALIPRLILSDVLQPVLGDSLPDGWSALRRSRDPKDASAVLLRDDYCLPLVFFHDIWQGSDDLLRLDLGAGAAGLGLANTHFEAGTP